MSFLSDVIQGIMGNEAADKAADASIDASKRANETMLEMFNRSNQITAPNQQAGWNALAMQGSLLGNPNMVPQGAVNQAIMAQGGGGQVWDQYLQANPDVQAAFAQASRTPHLRNMGITTPQQWAEYHYNTTGQREGRQLPSATGTGNVGAPGSSGQVGVGTDVNSAYNTFLDSGFGRANLTTTNADFENMVGAFGAGGNALSGSAIGALNDRNKRNTGNAFNSYYNALSGISGTGEQLGSQQASQANQVGSNIASNQVQQGQVRGSSYANRFNAGDAYASLEKNAAQAAGWFGG